MAIRDGQGLVAVAGREVGLVQVAEHPALQLAPRDRRHRALHVGQRVGAGDHPHPLVVGGQEVRVPDLVAVVRLLGREHDERGQVRVERAQAVADPRAEARQRDRDRAGVHAQGRGRVAGRVAVDRVQEAEVVDDPADVLEQLADHLARTRPAGGTRRARPGPCACRPVLSWSRLELRLVVERVEVRDPAGHEEDDQVLRLRREVARPRRERVARVRRGGDREPAIEAQAAGRGEGRGAAEEGSRRFIGSAAMSWDPVGRPINPRRGTRSRRAGPAPGRPRPRPPGGRRGRPRRPGSARSAPGTRPPAPARPRSARRPNARR